MPYLKSEEEYQAMRSEILQRSSFQHAYILLNIAGAGSILSYALTQNSSRTLLVLPILSFALFMLWFHQALVITHRGLYLGDKFPGEWQSHQFEYFRGFGNAVHVLSHLLGQVLHFVGAPMLALVLYKIGKPEGSCIYSWIFYVDVLLVCVSFTAFLIWCLEFYCRSVRILFKE